ncbi:MAG: hypothetical protein HY255_06655 [Betaproteobacteria bacterium]|nr:hypothetical protein [Betaproteobacteria bacterium]
MPASSNNVSQSGPVSPDAGADMEDIERRNMLAKLLRQQASASLDPNRQIGGVAYRISPLEGLAKLAQGLAAGKLDQDNAAAWEALRKQRPAANPPQAAANPAPAGTPVVPPYATATPQFNGQNGMQPSTPGMLSAFNTQAGDPGEAGKYGNYTWA